MITSACTVVDCILPIYIRNISLTNPFLNLLQFVTSGIKLLQMLHSSCSTSTSQG